MQKVKVLATKEFFKQDIEYLLAGLSSNIRLEFPVSFSVEVIAEAATEAHVLLGDVVTKEILNNAPCLKLIQVPWTGIERLDFDLIRQYPVIVCNSHSNASAVAEYAVALLLDVMKKIAFHDRNIRYGRWFRPSREHGAPFYPSDRLSGKTVGFIGFGSIARRIAHLLVGFDVEMIAVASKRYEIVPEPLSSIVGLEALDSVIERADILFIAVPLTKKTARLIDGGRLAKMKSTAYLVNIARGEVIPEDDLYEVLANHRIAGAALDAWYNYPRQGQPEAYPSTRNPFHELDNVVLSPHRAAFLKGEIPHLSDVVENLNRFATSQPLINVVNLEEGY
jgi:phosphoglycerate dehydrogenase-like enzyme